MYSAIFCCLCRANQHVSNHSLEVSLNIKLMKFGPVDRHDLTSLGRHYYTQDLMYNNQEWIFTTDSFSSTGIQYGMDKKPERLISTSPYFFRVFKAVEDEATRILKFPGEFQIKHSSEESFKRLLPMSNIYVKLNQDAVFFYTACRPMKKEELGHGNYRVVLHVKGLYIGPHGKNASKFASLQLRIKQIQFVAVPVTCLFAVPVAPPQMMAAMPPPPPETPQPGVTKKLRRPKLQRQNTVPVSDDKIQESQQRPMEQFPTDFFSDLDF